MKTIYIFLILSLIFQSLVFAKKHKTKGKAELPKFKVESKNVDVNLKSKKRKSRELKVIKRNKKKIQKDNKKFSQENFIKKKEIEKLEIINTQIENISEIIEDMDDENPDKPKYLLNLAEKYRRKSKGLWLKAMSYDDVIAKYEDSKNKAKVKEFEKKKDKLLKESIDVTLKSVEIYKGIYKTYPNYNKMDFVLFSWAHTLEDIKQSSSAVKVYKKLAKDYPDSRFIPDAFLALGEYYFMIDDMETAKKAYTKVLQYNDSELYNYALYKRGWCDFNLKDTKTAFKVFVKILQDGDPNEKFINQVKADLVFVFSQFANPDAAEKVFKKLFGDPDYLEYLEKLAYLYKDKQGKFEEAVVIFNRLLELESDEIKLMQYRIAILDVAISLGKLRNLIRTVLRTSDYMVSIKDQYKDDEEFKKLKNQLEAIIKELATTYHSQAKTTFNDVYFKIAWKFYKEYQRLFVGYEDYYPMLFQYAQLLDEDLHRKEDAIDVYIQIITDDGGKQAKNLVEDAVNNALSIYAELIKEERAKKGAQGNCHRTKNKKPQKLTRRQIQFIKLVDIFIKHNPKSKEIPSARYSAARVYYQTCHFDKAVPVFEDIVDNYQDSPVYEPAASILLDMLNSKKEYTEMHKRVTQFMKYKNKFSKKFRKQLQENFEALAFMSPKELEEKKKYVESAKAYYAYYKKYPNSNNAFYSLYNASQMYENAGLMKETIKIREEIIANKKFDNKKERKDVLFFLAQNYQALVKFYEAAKLYASFFEKYPRDKRAKTALKAAISFYEIYGTPKSLKQANNLIDTYVSKYRLNLKKKSKWLFEKGVNIENTKKWKAALKYWAKYERDYRKVISDEKVIEIQFRIGNMYKKLGNRKSAIKKYRDGYQYYQKLSPRKKKRIKKARKMLASYKFYELEKKYKEFKRIRIKLPKSVMLRTLKQKIKLKDFLMKSYIEGYKEFKNPDWSIAYFYKMASLLYDFAKDIQNAPIPKFRKTRDITVQEQVDMYKDDLYQAYVYPLEQEAFKAALRCYNIAMKNQIFNEWVDKSMQMMIKIDSSAFKVNLDEQHQSIDFNDIIFTREEPVLEIKNKKKVGSK